MKIKSIVGCKNLALFIKIRVKNTIVVMTFDYMGVRVYG